MSYTIAIVAPPIPAADKEAWDALDSLIDQQGAVPSEFKTLHDQLISRFPCISSLSDDEIDSGVWSDGPLWNNFGHRAAVLGMVYSRVDDVLPFVIQTAAALDFAVFDWATGHVHRADGLKGFSLSLENRPVLRAPNHRQLQGAVDALTPNGGPGYLILEGPGQHYAQAAGGDGTFTAEWREYTGEAFRHWVAGHLELASDNDIEIPTNGFVVTVKENERLANEDVKTILSAFAQGHPRPPTYVWRDISDRFT